MSNQENVTVVEEIAQDKELTLKSFRETVTVITTSSVRKQTDVVEQVWKACVEKDELNNIYYIDTIMKIASMNIAILGMYTDFNDIYTDIEFPYDLLNNLGIFDYVYTTINQNDLAIIKEAINGFDKRVEALNGVGASLGRTLNDIVTKIPDTKEIGKLVNKLPKLINSVDKDVIATFAKELKSGVIMDSATSEQIVVKDNVGNGNVNDDKVVEIAKAKKTKSTSKKVDK